ncbi:MAG: extracellular solute-binding protein, partial [Psychrobacter sp.]|nr:extracellular solute-binding protein [Psychrobacter sp.]
MQPSIQKTSNTLNFSNIASPIETIESQNTPAQVTNGSVKAGSVLAFAMLITGCNPTEANQSKAAKAGDVKDIDLLNVSYDVSRDFYKDYNALFSADYQQQHPNSKVNINQSHGGSSKQALTIANGLQADVATLNQESDMNLLVEKGLVAADWQQALPNNA